MELSNKNDSISSISSITISKKNYLFPSIKYSLLYSQPSQTSLLNQNFFVYQFPTFWHHSSLTNTSEWAQTFLCHFRENGENRKYQNRGECSTSKHPLKYKNTGWFLIFGATIFSTVKCRDHKYERKKQFRIISDLFSLHTRHGGKVFVFYGDAMSLAINHLSQLLWLY